MRAATLEAPAEPAPIQWNERRRPGPKSAIQWRIDDLPRGFRRSRPAPEVGRSMSERLEELVAWWRAETGFSSDLGERLLHPAYQRIIALGPEVTPYLFRLLETTRTQMWRHALSALTRHDPTAPGMSSDEAIDAWLQFGRDERYLA